MCIVKPPLGVIVEGRGEFECFPSIICRLCNDIAQPPYLLNARGNGEITAHLEEHLSDLAETRSPLTILVCLDLKDALMNPKYTTCEELISNLRKRAISWKTSDRVETSKLPDEIQIIAQVPKFESWMISDINSASNSSQINTNSLNIPRNITNVDAQITSPQSLLKKLFPKKDIKNPNFVRAMITNSNPDEMEKNSRSFKKFAKEAKLAIDRYNKYLGSNFGN